MVCVEELCSIFKNLHPHKRIQLMCGLLQCCVPLELRFIGSYVENLGRRDFHYLREYELKANSCPEINKLFEASEDVTRHKLAVYLSLLHTSNSTCSKLCFDLLISLNTCLIPTYASPLPCKKANIDVMLELLTVLVMGINHPAFTFEQRFRLFEIYRWLEAKAERLSPMSTDKDNPPGDGPVYGCVSQPGSAFAPTEEPMLMPGHMDPFVPPGPVDPSCLPGLSPRDPHVELGECHEPQFDSATCIGSPAGSLMNSPNEPLHVLHSPVEPQMIPAYMSGLASADEDKWPRMEVGQSPSQSESPLHCDPQEKVFIRRVEVKGSRKTERKQAFRMEVTWSNGELCEVYKSYQELYEFHTKLVQLFPEDASIHRQDRKLPFLSGNPQTGSREDKADQKSAAITNYLRKLVSLQRDILGCDHVIQFFRESPLPRRSSSVSGAGYKAVHLTSSHTRPCATYETVSCHPNVHSMIISSRQKSPPADLSVSDPLSPQMSPSQSQPGFSASPEMSPNESVLGGRSLLSPRVSPRQATQTSHAPLPVEVHPGQSSHSPLSPQRSPNQADQISHSPLSPELSPNQSTRLSPVMHPNDSVLPSHPPLSPCTSSNPTAEKHSRPSSPKYAERLPTVQQLLEDLQLSHYGDKFNKYSTLQLLNLKEEDFKVFKLSSHALKRLRTRLEQVSRTPKLPNGVTAEGAVHMGLPAGPVRVAGEGPHLAQGELALPPATLYTSTACIGQLTGSDAGNSSFDSSPPASPRPSNPSQTITLTKKAQPAELQMLPDAEPPGADLQDTPRVEGTEASGLDGVDSAHPSCCDRPGCEGGGSSPYEPVGKEEPAKGMDPGRVLVLAGPKAVDSGQCLVSEEELTELDDVAVPPHLPMDPRAMPNLTPTEIPHLYQSGYVSDPTHSYPPRPTFPRMFPPMYPMGPPQPAHLPIQMFQKVSLSPDQVHPKMTGQYRQSYMQPHSRSDTASLANTVMTVTVNSSASPATIASNTQLNRTVTLQNPVNPRFALSSSLNTGLPYSSPAGPPVVHRKNPGAQNSNNDSGMSSPATSIEAVSYGPGQQINSSVGNTPPYSPSAVQAPLLGAIHSTCSSCGCRGRCGGSPSYSAAYGGYVQTQVNMPPLVHIPTFLPPNSNGILPSPCLPPNCPMPFHSNPLQNVPNGIVPEHFSFHLSHGAGHTPNLWNSMLYGYSSHANAPGPRDNKPKPTCYNCGGAGHEAHDCRDVSMESSSGQYSLNFKPDFPE